MLPAQRNKVDISKLSPDEQKAFRLYGKLPSRSVAKAQERKYFDSGDWALSKAGKQKGEYGKEIPTPDAIPHASPSPMAAPAMTPGGGAGSPGSGAVPSVGTGSPPTGMSLGTPAATLGGGGGAGGAMSPGGRSSNPLSPPGALPISPPSNGASNAVNMSMSPGRVGVGSTMGMASGHGSNAGPGSGPSPNSGSLAGSAHALATSPTRSFGSFPIAHSHNHSTAHHHHIPLTASPSSPPGGASSSSSSSGVGVGVGSMHGAPSSSAGQHSGLGTSPMVAATTGNQIGRTQIRRTSQSDSSPLVAGDSSASSSSNATPSASMGVPIGVGANANMITSAAGQTASPPPTSGLANSVTADSLMEEDDDDVDEQATGKSTSGNAAPRVSGLTASAPGAGVGGGPGSKGGEDESVEGMELQ